MTIETVGLATTRDALAEHALFPPARHKNLTGCRVRVSNSLLDVEDAWRQLEALGIESPGQSYEFVKVWVETFDVAHDDQCFVAIEHNGKPLAVLALQRRLSGGVRLLEPFAPCHVGVNGPLMDIARLNALHANERADLWRQVVGALDADLLLFPDMMSDQTRLFDGIGMAARSETLYRTAFETWEACDQEQRNRSRRKHDKQQGAKLAAMGDVRFDVITREHDTELALDTMFADRAARFAEQGISDPFATPKIRAFYRTIFETGERLKGVMQVLKLDGKIVATRYNLVMGEKMFCLISSMNTRPELQPGSPGKQILLRLMQSIFADGIRVFDMGAGFSDEKRHWCNVQVPLSNLYVPLTLKGRAFALLKMAMARTKNWIKSNQQVFTLLKKWRARLAGVKN